MKTYTTYFVLNGLVNGERGCPAILAGGGDGPIQEDGFYFLIEGESDGEGPFECREDADEAGVEWTKVTQTWLFPLDGSEPRISVPDRDDSTGDENVGTISLGLEGVYSCSVEGSYETLTLILTAPSHAKAALVFAAALRAQSEFV